jgi:hypothetical protein
MVVRWLLVIFLVTGLPLLANYLADGDLGFVTAFPPNLGRVTHNAFNPILTSIALFLSGAAPVVWFLLRRKDRIYRHSITLKRRHFPKWGYVGYVLLIGSWIIAWMRFPFFEPVQAYTFTPLWIGFIVVVNAHVHRLSNSAPLYKTPWRFFGLFLVSAVFWWGFEYLNRFTENWIYVGAAGVSALHYYLHGSLCFSTVLPAVYSVYLWLYCFDGLHRRFYLGPKLPFLKKALFGYFCLLTGVLGMIGVGIFPEIAYPFLWLGPVLIYGGIRLTFGVSDGLSAWARGDWRWVAFWGLAGLICGFFWEMWNFPSLLKWQYEISFFNGWQVFEMPLLGYLGYLPFGVFCGLVTQWVFKEKASVAFSPND